MRSGELLITKIFKQINEKNELRKINNQRWNSDSRAAGMRKPEAVHTILKRLYDESELVRELHPDEQEYERILEEFKK